MAKIKKIDSQILHLSNKHISGVVHPRLQKHTRQMPKADPRIVRSQEDARLRRMKDLKKSTKEKDEKKKYIEEKAKYDFPFDKGYLAWLNDELRYSSLSEAEKQNVAESSKYQNAYERQTSKSYKDGSKLGGGGSSIAGFTADYVRWLSGVVKGWELKTHKEQTELANGSLPQRHYSAITGLDPKDNSGSKAPSYTAEYTKWVRNEFNPKSPADEEEIKANEKVQSTYTAKTGLKPKG